MFEKHTDWIIDKLKEWEFTFDEKTNIPELISKINHKSDMSHAELDEFIFHIWQIDHG
jgi:hypothetical protein